MKNTLISFSVITTLLFSGLSLAGTHGPGGDALQCKVGANTVLQSLDTYEAKVEFPWLKLGLGAPHLTVDERIDFILGKMKPTDSARASIWAKEAHLFLSRVHWVNEEIPFTLDTGTLKIHANCKVHQVVLQRTGSVPSYEIDANLWKRLPQTQQVALILHYVIRAEAVSFGQTNSQMIRYFNISLLTNRFETFKTERDYVSWLREIGWKWFEKMGIPLTLAENWPVYMGFNKDGSISDGGFWRAVDFSVGKNRFQFSKIPSDAISVAFEYNFEKKCHIVYVQTAIAKELIKVGNYTLKQNDNGGAGGFVSFYPDDSIDWFVMEPTVFQIQNKKVLLDDSVQFSPEGKLMRGRTVNGVDLQASDGSTISFYKGQNVYLDRNGFASHSPEY